METNKQNGSSLVEVMVALFVLAIGLLGVLALQAKSIRFNQSSYSYSQAVYLANSLAERISVNPQGKSQYVNFDPDASADISTGCDTSGCDPNTLAEWDKQNWFTQIKRTLPAGLGRLELEGTDHVKITVSFDDSRSDSREPGEALEGVDDDTDYTGRQEYSILVGL